MALKLIKLVDQLTDEQVAEQYPAMDAQLVEVGDTGKVEPITPQRRFVLEFDPAIGEITANATDNVPAAAGDAPTKAEFDAQVTAYNEAAGKLNELITEFNQLVTQLDNNGLIQTPHT